MLGENPSPLQEWLRKLPTSEAVTRELRQFRPLRLKPFRWFLLGLPWLILATIAIGGVLTIWNPLGPTLKPPTPGDVMFYTGMIAAAFALVAFHILMRRIAQALRAMWEQGIVIADPSTTGRNAAEPNAGQSPIERIINRRQWLIANAKRQLSNRGREEDPSEPPKNTVRGSEVADPVDEQAANNQLVKQYLAYIGNYESWLNHWGQWIMAGFFTLLAVIWTTRVAHLPQTWSPEFFVTFTEYPIAFLIGYLVWRILVAGALTWQIGNNLYIEPQPGNADRSGGLESLGSLCLWNALIASMGGIYFGGWLIVAVALGPPVDECADRMRIVEQVKVFSYGCQALYWKSTYIKLTLVPIALAIIGFFAPVWRVHRIMEAKRAILQSQLHELEHLMFHQEQRILNQANELQLVELESLTRSLELNRQAHRRNSTMPVWPYNFRILFKVGLSQTVPVLGLIINVVFRVISVMTARNGPPVS